MNRRLGMSAYHADRRMAEIANLRSLRPLSRAEQADDEHLSHALAMRACRMAERSAHEHPKEPA